ncbi:MAG TPA: EI24 domain-containing protein, partial [Actinomycetota bacterium]|nr:EI24 domain-containing protein [Actinomycetota bacterium]
MTDPPRWPAAPIQPPPPAPRAGGPVAGATDVLRGIGLFLRTPGVRLLGILPVVLAALLVLVLLGLLVVYLDELADALTPFADRWEEGSRTLVRVGAGLALLLTSTAVLVVSFTVIAQIIGQPFYERISDRVEHQLGA